MKNIARPLLAVVGFAVVLAVPQQSFAQMWSDAQTQVWKVVLDSWDAINAEDVTWSDKFVHPNAIVWGDQNPMPRNRASIKKWDRFDFENATTKVSDYSPAAIVVEGGTAVAHYYYSLGTQDSEGKNKTVHGRCTDILVGGGASWRFLSWNCGTESGDDD